jgi:hypothetical protein
MVGYANTSDGYLPATMPPSTRPSRPLLSAPLCSSGSLPPVDYNTNRMSLASLLLIYDDAKTTFLNMCCINTVFTFNCVALHTVLLIPLLCTPRQS